MDAVGNFFAQLFGLFRFLNFETFVVIGIIAASVIVQRMPMPNFQIEEGLDVRQSRWPDRLMFLVIAVIVMTWLIATGLDFLLLVGAVIAVLALIIAADHLSDYLDYRRRDRRWRQELMSQVHLKPKD